MRKDDIITASLVGLAVLLMARTVFENTRDSALPEPENRPAIADTAPGIMSQPTDEDISAIKKRIEDAGLIPQDARYWKDTGE